jgi:DMSO reductase anchor subunit
MHPAPSIILFSALSGLGFGTLAWLGLGLPPHGAPGPFWLYAIGFIMAGGGLMSSTFHLGNPQRALKAFTQWRTSWLSREAWLAILAFAITGIHALLVIFGGIYIAPLGWLSALSCLAVVYSTSMIYTQIKTIPRWHTPRTPMMFLIYALSGGALMAGQGQIAGILLAIALLAQLYSWNQGDQAFAKAGTTLETATGLGFIGKTKAFEPPHTGTNYLLKEMAFRIGRKHSQKLRIVGIVLATLIPMAIAFTMGAWWALALAALVHLGGILAIRWLFFAEAEHVVSLYYGKA